MVGLLCHPLLGDHQLFRFEFEGKLVSYNDDAICVLEDPLELVDGFQAVDLRQDCDLRVSLETFPDVLQISG